MSQQNSLPHMTDEEKKTAMKEAIRLTQAELNARMFYLASKAVLNFIAIFAIVHFTIKFW